MNRRIFLRSAAGSSLLPALAPGAAAAEPSGTGLTTSPPVAMAPRADGIEIVWGVARLALGMVVLDDGGGERTVRATPTGFSAQGDKVLRVRLDGLRPGTSYRYRAVTTAATAPAASHDSGWREFRTLDPAAASTHFAVWNDTHQQAETLGKLDDTTPPADFLIWNGDICNDWHEEKLIVPTLLHPAGRDITAKRPLQLVWGNHDVRGRWGFRLPDYTAMPAGVPYYAFRSGPVAAVCLHTGEDKADDHPSFQGRVAFDALRTAQARWLEDVVLRDPLLSTAPYRIVFCHIPLRWHQESPQAGYDWCSIRSRDVWHKSLVRWKTQVVISGHTHETAYLPATAAFPYAQLIGGGPKPDAATWIDGTADARALTLVMCNLAGREIERREFPPL